MAPRRASAGRVVAQAGTRAVARAGTRAVAQAGTRAVARAAKLADWAFHADDDAVLRALVTGRHAQSMREYFGSAAYAELTALAAAARRAPRRRGPKILILPGIMDSKIGGPFPADAPPDGARRRLENRVLWVDPLQIAAGRLTALRLPQGAGFSAVGVLLFSYARLKLKLEQSGREAAFHSYDWRLGLDELGAQLAARIAAERQPVILVAHSMGGLVARMATGLLPKRLVRKLILLGTPHQGSFASVQALRGTYPPVRRMSRLDRRHSADYLTTKVFSTFPGLYHMLPPAVKGIDLLDPRHWPREGPAPDGKMLARVAAVRAAFPPADARMIQVIGVNRETVVGLRRTSAGFEYTMTHHGDGTVPRDLAALPGIKSYFVEELHGNLASNPRVVGAIVDLVHRGRTQRLPQRWRREGGPARRIDDAQLRLEGAGKLDWRKLASAQREAILGELDSARNPALPRESPSTSRKRPRRPR
jgi:pimeloyl-ACP methyl ester carboxylesterase